MDELAGVSGGIEIELVDVPDRPDSIDEIVRRLTESGATVDRSGAVLNVVGFTDDELFDLAASSVAAAGGRIRRLAQRRRSLDDIFTLHADSGDSGVGSNGAGAPDAWSSGS
jgi:hypothetical protein